jgi:hypothetical protein
VGGQGADNFPGGVDGVVFLKGLLLGVLVGFFSLKGYGRGVEVGVAGVTKEFPMRGIANTHCEAGYQHRDGLLVIADRAHGE